MEHLRDERLIQFVAISEVARAAVLTEDGRDLLEANRRERDDRDPRQEFHAGVSHPRELHDSALFEAYLAIEERLRDQGAKFRVEERWQEMGLNVNSRGRD